MWFGRLLRMNFISCSVAQWPAIWEPSVWRKFGMKNPDLFWMSEAEMLIKAFKRSKIYRKCMEIKSENTISSITRILRMELVGIYMKLISYSLQAHVGWALNVQNALINHSFIHPVQLHLKITRLVLPQLTFPSDAVAQNGLGSDMGENPYTSNSFKACAEEKPQWLQ